MPHVSARPTYVIDTSCFVHDPNCLGSFSDCDIVIPMAVLEELDKLKSDRSDVGFAARQAIRTLDALSQSGDSREIRLDGGSVIRFDGTPYEVRLSDKHYGDNQIIACASHWAQSADVCVVSRDFALKLKARMLGMRAEGYDRNSRPADESFTGYQVIEHDECGHQLKATGVIPISEHQELLSSFYPNECVLFVDSEGNGIAPGRRVGSEIKLVREHKPFGISSKNCEQLFLLDMLMDRNVQLLTINGLAGSGKTLLSLAAGLSCVLEKRQYDTLNLFRPIVPLGGVDTLGFLPGTLEEKLENWALPLTDAFAYIFNDRTKTKDGWKAQLHQYLDNGTIKNESLMHIRGRSIHNAFILIDEAQNTTIEEIRAIVTRAGIGAKIILNGDVGQIDHRGLDKNRNGLAYVRDKLNFSSLTGHITLAKGERSELSELASKIL